MFFGNKNDPEEKITDIWHKYEKGVEYLHKINHVDKTNRCHRFYSGDHWHGMKSGGEELPSFNFIKGIIKYKASTVAQNSMAAVYSPMSKNPNDIISTKICELLGTYFERSWEKGKLDELSWKIIKDAAIQGDSYIFFGEGADVSEGQIIDNVNIFLSDEQSDNIQGQKYIIIRERRFISDIRKEAEENGISKDELDLIISDEDTKDQLGNKIEVKSDSKDGKCISLLYMEKDEEGYVHISRSVKSLVYQSDTSLRKKRNGENIDAGLKSYPVINFVWDDKKGSGRGYGEVEHLIANQIEVNKTIARRSIAVKQTAYPMLAYSESLINNPDDLDVIGGKIAINNGNAQAINQLISYLRPAQISPDAKNLCDELITGTKELAGAGDSATGNIDPTQASGTAIIAVRDQAQLPLNEQVARFSQFAEDLACLWFDMWVAYEAEGLEIETEQGVVTVPIDQLEELKVNVKIDVSKSNPFSLYATEQSLHNYWQAQAITFEEMVDALPAGCAAPKNKLKEIIDKRAMEEQKEAEIQKAMGGLQEQNAQLAGQLQQMTQALSGGIPQEAPPQEMPQGIPQNIPINV